MIACDRADLFGRRAFGGSEQDTSNPTIFLGVSLFEKFHEDPVFGDGALRMHTISPPELPGSVQHPKFISKANV